MENIVSLITESLPELKELVEDNCLILLHISNTVKVPTASDKTIKGKTQFLVKEMNQLATNANFEDYMKAFNECFKAINKDGQNNEKGALVRRMIKLVKDSCMNQLYLETLLNLPCKVAQLIMKNRAHVPSAPQVVVETMHKNTFYKYLMQMEKPDFIRTTLMEEIDLKEFFEVISLLLQQTQFINEIKASKQFQLFFDKYIFTTNEFSKIYFDWKSNLGEMAEIEKNPKYLRELEEMKNFYYFDPTSNSIFELSKFTKKLWDYQQKLITYHSFCQYLSIFRKEVVLS